MSKTQFFLWVGLGIVVFGFCLTLLQRDYVSRVQEINMQVALFGDSRKNIELASLVSKAGLHRQTLLYEPIDITDYHSDIMLLYP